MKSSAYICVAVSAAMMVGCASKPKDIQPTFVRASQYDSMDCHALSIEIARVDAELATAIETQEGNVNKNVAMIVLFGALGGLATQGKESEANVARLKGEQLALNDAAIKKRCQISLPTPAPTAPPKQ